MSKKCLKCNSINNDDVNFCRNCGSSEFAQLANPNPPIQNQQVGGQLNNFGVQPPQFVTQTQPEGYQQTAVATKKRGLAWWHILLIVFGGVMLIVIPIIVMAANAPVPQSETLGRVENGKYINEWANIQFEISDEWPQGDQSDYDLYSGEKSKAAFVSRDIIEGKQFVIETHDFSDAYDWDTADIDDYLDLQMDEAKDTFNDLFEDYGLSLTESDVFDLTIAGENYRCMKLLVGGQVTMLYCTRKVDDYALNIMITAKTNDEIEDLLRTIEPIE